MEEIVLRHIGRVKERRLFLDDLKLYNANLIDLDGKEVELVIYERTKSPTLGQYGYYHCGILPAALKSEVFGGWTKERLDSFISNMFLGETTIEKIKGIPVEVKSTPSKADISKKKMTLFIERVIAFLTENGIEVPPPEKVATKKYSKDGKFISRS